MQKETQPRGYNSLSNILTSSRKIVESENCDWQHLAGQLFTENTAEHLDTPCSALAWLML